MGIYDDLLPLKEPGSLLSKLRPVEAAQLARLTQAFGSLPQDYLTFLSLFGGGQIGQAQYMLYGAPMEPSEIYSNVPPQLATVILFGDDFQGFNAGFERGSWKIVEVDPLDLRTSVVAASFEEFVRRKIRQFT